MNFKRIRLKGRTSLKKIKKMYQTVEKVGVDDFRALLPERVCLSDEDLMQASCTQVGLVRPVFVGAAYKGLLAKRGIVGTEALKRWVAEKGCLANSTVKALIDRANN